MIGTRILEESYSKFNGKIKVVKTWGLGTYIQAGGLTQSGGIIESIWRPTLKRLKKENVQTCLILGLGGGTVVKVVKKYWPEAKITGVDIDPLMIKLGKKYLGLDPGSVAIKIGDAAGFTGKKYDLVIVDLYNGYKFPPKFETDKFLKPLRKNHVVVFNRIYFKNEIRETKDFEIKIRKIFGQVKSFRPPTNIMFICSTKLKTK